MRWMAATSAMVLALLVSAAAPSQAKPPVSAKTGETAAADARFRALYTREWEWRRREIGIDDEDDSSLAVRAKLPDVSAATQAKRLAYLEQVKATLDAISPARLSPEVQVDYAVYRAQVARWHFRDWEKPVGSSGGFWNNAARDARRTFRTEQDYRNFLTLMRDVPRYFDDQIANMRAGLARGFTAPRATLEGRDKPLAAIAEAASPEATPFYAPFKTMPASIPPERQTALRAEAATEIRDIVIPAHKKALAFFRDVYMPGARTTLAAEALPDGKAYYRSKIREFVTLDLDPEAVHATGLAEVAKLRAEMEATKADAGFKGDLPAFFDFLRTDPRFYPKSEHQLLAEAAWQAKRFDGIAHLWFGTIPRRRFGITPMPAATAPFATGALGAPAISCSIPIICRAGRSTC